MERERAGVVGNLARHEHLAESFGRKQAFLKMLPDVTGLKGLDIGCGEGYKRASARRGGVMTAIDISEVFINRATREREEPLGIEYQVASAVELTGFGDATFDFATGDDEPDGYSEFDLALNEAYRVFEPGGFFQFSITIPCFDTPHRKNLRKQGKGKPMRSKWGDAAR